MVSLPRFLSRRRRRQATPKTPKSNKKAKNNDYDSPRQNGKSKSQDSSNGRDSKTKRSDKKLGERSASVSSTDSLSTCGDNVSSAAYIAGHDNKAGGGLEADIDIDKGYRMQLEQDEREGKEREREKQPPPNPNIVLHQIDATTNNHVISPSSFPCSPIHALHGLAMNPHHQLGPPPGASNGKCQFDPSPSDMVMYPPNDMTIVDLQSTIDFLTTKLQQSESQVKCLQEQNGKLRELFLEEQQTNSGNQEQQQQPHKLTTNNSSEMLAPCSLKLPETKKEPNISSLANSVGQRLRKQLWVDTGSPMSAVGRMFGCGAFSSSLPNSPWTVGNDMESPSILSPAKAGHDQVSLSVFSRVKQQPPHEPEQRQVQQLPQVFIYDEALQHQLSSYKSQVSMLEHEKKDMQRQLMHLQVQTQVQHETMASLEEHLQSLHLHEQQKHQQKQHNKATKLMSSSVKPAKMGSSTSSSSKRRRNRQRRQHNNYVPNNTPVSSPKKQHPQPPTQQAECKPPHQQQQQQQHPFIARPPTPHRPQMPRPHIHAQQMQLKVQQEQHQVDEIVAALSQVRSVTSATRSTTTPRSHKAKRSGASTPRCKNGQETCPVTTAVTMGSVPSASSCKQGHQSHHRRVLSTGSHATGSSKKYSSAIRAGSFTASPSRSGSHDKDDDAWHQQQQQRMMDLQHQLHQEEQQAQHRLHQELLQHWHASQHQRNQKSQSSFALDSHLQAQTQAVQPADSGSPAHSRQVLL